MAKRTVLMSGDNLEIKTTNPLPVTLYDSSGTEIGNSQTSKIIGQEI